jgi:hypothetical protein
MIYLFIRLMLWVIGALLVLTVLALWAFAYALIFVVSFVWVAFGETRKAKRLKRPALTRRRNDDRGLDAFGHPIPQSHWSSRR